MLRRVKNYGGELVDQESSSSLTLRRTWAVKNHYLHCGGAVDAASKGFYRGVPGSQRNVPSSGEGVKKAGE